MEVEIEKFERSGPRSSMFLGMAESNEFRVPLFFLRFHRSAELDEFFDSLV